MPGSATATPTPAQRDSSGSAGHDVLNAQPPYLLEISNISKGFPGVIALNDVQLRVRPGSVLALMGENGAGKSTLMKIMPVSISPTQAKFACEASPSRLTRRCRPCSPGLP